MNKLKSIWKWLTEVFLPENAKRFKERWDLILYSAGMSFAIPMVAVTYLGKYLPTNLTLWGPSLMAGILGFLIMYNYGQTRDKKAIVEDTPTTALLWGGTIGTVFALLIYFMK